MKFDQRIAVITGGAGNIGKAIARKFLAQKVTVVLTDLSMDRLRQSAADLGGDSASLLLCEMDVTKLESVQKAARKIFEVCPQVDILDNNAGVWDHPNQKVNAFAETPEEYWEWILAVNLSGTFRVTQAFLPAMIRQRYGRIINLGSIAGEVGLPGHCDYAAAKGGVIMMTKTLAMELAKDNITVNCVSPGMIKPDDTPGIVPNNGTWVGRSGFPSEVAEAIAFFAADDAGFITGVDCPVDGGRTLGPHNCNF